MDAETEQVTMTIAVTYSSTGIESKLHKLWIGHVEVPIDGRSIPQCLEEMRAQGWTLSHSRATADFHGIVCEYDFWQPIPRHKVIAPLAKSQLNVYDSVGT